MTNATYDRAAATVKRLLSKYGATLTVRAKGTPSDPVDGSGGGEGETRDVIGVLTSVKDGLFDESLRKAGDRMIVFAPEANIQLGEKWVESGNEWPILDLKTVKPDNETVIAYRALVRG